MLRCRPPPLSCASRCSPGSACTRGTCRGARLGGPHPVGGAGQRGDAPGDPGGPGGAGVAVVDGPLADARGPGGGADRPTCCAHGTGWLPAPRAAARGVRARGRRAARRGGAVVGALSLLALPGVGSYTAAAVLVFAFGGGPWCSTNVRRALVRTVDGVALPVLSWIPWTRSPSGTVRAGRRRDGGPLGGGVAWSSAPSCAPRGPHAATPARRRAAPLVRRGRPARRARRAAPADPDDSSTAPTGRCEAARRPCPADSVRCQPPPSTPSGRTPLSFPGAWTGLVADGLVTRDPPASVCMTPTYWLPS